MKVFSLAIGLVITLMAAVPGLYAQQHDFGIKGGLSPYTLTFTGSSDQVMRPRVHIGFMARFHLHPEEAFYIQPELNYSLQGARFKNSDRLITLDYIQVPVLFQFEPAEGLLIQGGPVMSFLLTARSDSDGAAEDLSRKIHSRDFGLTIGASYIFRPAGVGVDLRYNQGVRMISDNSDLRSRNRGFHIGVFYLFDFDNSRN